MIRLLIFDLWNTLAVIKGGSTTSAIIKEFNLDINKEKFRKIYEQSYQTKKWSSKYEAYKQLCLDISIPATDENVKKMVNMSEKTLHSIELYPHTLKMLKQLKTNYKIGLISNSSLFSIELLKQSSSLFDYIDYPLFSFEVNIIKPDLGIFKKMLEESNYKPSEAVMIGDSFEDDIVPARKLGMNAIHFQNYEQLKKELASLGVKVA